MAPGRVRREFGVSIATTENEVAVGTEYHTDTPDNRPVGATVCRFR